jgi:hypothetical protein
MKKNDITLITDQQFAVIALLNIRSVHGSCVAYTEDELKFFASNNSTYRFYHHPNETFSCFHIKDIEDICY